jgi:photosystem II stability/assembly factor-like uncharacterized protein
MIKVWLHSIVDCFLIRRSLPVLILFLSIGLTTLPRTAAQEELAWRPQKSGVLAKLAAAYFIDADHGWVAGSNGTLLATEDGGQKWRRVTLPEREAREPIHDLWFFDATRGCVLGEYGMYNRRGSAVAAVERIFVLSSKDAGAYWAAGELAAPPQPVRTGLSGRAVAAGPVENKPVAAVPIEEPKPQPDAVLTRLAFANASIGWACGETGAIQATTDGGATWQMQYALTKKLLYDIVAINEKRVVIVGAGGTVLRTNDGGRNWFSGNSGATATLRGVHFANSLHGWAVGSNGTILATSNGGADWQPQTSGVTQTLNDVFFLTLKEGWAAGERGVLLHTIDGGATWEAIALDTHASLFRLAFVSPDCGWVVGASGTIVKFGKE